MYLSVQRSTRESAEKMGLDIFYSTFARRKKQQEQNTIWEYITYYVCTTSNTHPIPCLTQDFEAWPKQHRWGDNLYTVRSAPSINSASYPLRIVPVQSIAWHIPGMGLNSVAVCGVVATVADIVPVLFAGA